MIKTVNKLIKHPLVSSTTTIFFGNLIINFFNFLYSFFMLHTLSVANYGVLASIISFIGFPTLAVGALGTVVVRFAGSYFATGKLDMARGLYLKVFRVLFVIGSSMFIFYIIFIHQIGDFFHIHNIVILLVTIMIIVISLMTIVNMGFLQAKLAFTFQVITNGLATFSKLLFGVGFVLLGFSVNGAVVAMLISAVIMYLVSFIPIQFIFDKKISPIKLSTKELITYGIPSAATILGMTSFISTDIILVKHFFNPMNAGIYAGLSLVARVIFYFSSPIGNVMFPLLVQKYSKKEKVFGTFILSLLFVLIPSIGITLFYYFFPTFSILFFSKKEYLVAAPYLTLFSIFATLYSVLNVLVYFYLAIHKTIIVLPVLLAAIAQIILIFFFHQVFTQVITISLLITFLLTIVLLLYYPYATKK